MISNKKTILFAMYCALALLFSLILALSIMYDISQIHIYRHDALYYISQHTYLLKKVSTEGRWINYLFFPITTKLSGSFLSIFILFSFFTFIWITIYKWTQNIYYSTLLSLLFLQIPSFYDLIQWPATSVLAFVILLLSLYFVKHLSIFMFYIVFGILFFGTMSNYYYLLPLLYLKILYTNNSVDNMKFVFFQLIPAWAIGFILGYAVTEAATYILVGHPIQIAFWRQPHYIYSIDDLMHNISLSFQFLERDIRNIFATYWHIVAYGAALIIAFYKREKNVLFISVLLFFLMIIVHYIAMIPIGIFIAERTVVATWVGIFAIVFFIPRIQQWKMILLIPIIIFFTYGLYKKNHANLQWFHAITDTHFKMLLKEVPRLPVMYKGLVVYANNSDIYHKNMSIEKQHSLRRDMNIEGLDHVASWKTSALEAGFKRVEICNTAREMSSMCKEMLRSAKRQHIVCPNTHYYDIIGEYKGKLLISFKDFSKNR